MKNQWVAGVHAVRQALDEGSILRVESIEGKRSKNLLQLLKDLQAANVEIAIVPRYALDMRLPDVRHQGIAALCQIQQQASTWQAAIAGIEKPLVLVLDGIQDPHNLGACLRSALAAGVDAVLLPNSRAADINATVHKVSCGASEVLPIFRVPNLKREVQAMKEKGLWVVGGAGEESISLYDIDLTSGLVLIVGNEAEGIRYGLRESCDYLAAIPMTDKMESLNVSVACGVMLFETRRQRLQASKI